MFIITDISRTKLKDVDTINRKSCLKVEAYHSERGAEPIAGVWKQKKCKKILKIERIALY